MTFGGTTIQLLDEGGATRTIDDETLGEVEATFQYVDAKRAAKRGCDVGWYFVDDSDYEACQNGRVIPFGSGLLIDCSDDDAALLFNGQVRGDAAEVELVSGAFNFTGNCTPAGITFGDITPNENVTFGGTTIQLLDEGGATRTIDDETLGEVEATFQYVDAKRAAKRGCDVGWYYVDDSEYEACQNNRPLAAGEGILVDCSDDDATITIPSAL